MGRKMRVILTVAASAFLGAECLAAPPSPHEDIESLQRLIDTYCLDCHDGARAKGDCDLSELASDATLVAPGILRKARDRLRRMDMPPNDLEAEPGDRPSVLAYAATVTTLETLLDRHAASASPGRPTLRRLNRTEYQRSVAALVGVAPDVMRALPADDVGEGFDHIGDVLSMPPTLLEKYLDLAERIALEAWPDDIAPIAIRRGFAELTVPSGGRVSERDATVWSRGAARGVFDVPRAGTYRIRFGAWGEQAGGEPVKVAVTVGRDSIASFELPETRAAPGERMTEARLTGGEQVIAIEFLNDFFDESLPVASRDRNLHVLSITLEGPLDRVAPTAAVRALTGEGSLDLFVQRLLSAAFRRPVSGAECAEFLDILRTAAPPEASASELGRIAIVAALVDPRFLFRIEGDPAAGEAQRALDGYELASRLSYFLWSAPPDAELMAAAADGSLTRDAALCAAMHRMLDDPRSIALAEQFGQQWLLIRDVEAKSPDPERFSGVDEALLSDMKGESTLFLDTMIREDRRIDELLSAEWSFLNDRLARHYGLTASSGAIEGAWLRRVHIGPERVPGLLGHGSVLVATSNPTRTSLVKRGKWVLEALLDEPPPPPPPGTPLLLEPGEAGGAASVRERLARHRADPGCAGCHRRMDAIGFALEPLDAVGRPPRTDDGAEIDARGDLPDGRSFSGPHELAALLRDDPAVRRSLVRHLMTYALGRGLNEEDQAVVDRLARALGPDATMRSAIQAVVLSAQFRLRSAPSQATGGLDADRSTRISIDTPRQVTGETKP